MPGLDALLDNARKARSLSSDNALAAHFGLHRQAVSKWRNGEAWPSKEHIEALAELAGMDAGEWLLRVDYLRSDGGVRRSYGKLMKRLGIAAIVLTPLLAYASPTKQGASAHLEVDLVAPRSIDYAKWLMAGWHRFCRWLAPHTDAYRGRHAVDGVWA